MLIKFGHQKASERITTSVFLSLVGLFSSVFRLAEHEIDFKNILLVFILHNFPKFTET